MHANDERDPLDRWLSQQVQPLPPPPGTFELISRRARTRKLRKLAVTLVSAAAVAAAVAVAVPVGLNLHLNQPPTDTQPVAEGATATHSSAKGTESAYGDGNRTLSPSPSASSPSASSPSATTPVSVAGGPVPANFQPTSVTFVSANDAWVIGQAGTPGQCDNKDSYICTSIARTDNAGQSWRGEHAPDTGGPSGATGVSGIRFLNPTYGWAFGPELWATEDGGTTWNKVDIGGSRVTDLETSDGRAYALFATCSGTASVGFAYDCTSYTLMTTTAGSGSWTPVGGATNGLTNGGKATSAVLALTGSNGYLLAPDGTLYSGPIGGTWSRVGTSICQPGAAQFNGLPSAAQLALQNPSNVAIACTGTADTAPAEVSFSADGGATWTQQPAAVWSGVSHAGQMTSFSYAPNGALVLATTAGIYYYPVNGSHWSASNATGSKAPRGGFSYIGMTTDQQGVALPSDDSLHQIWMTQDGGQTWSPATSIAPVN
jgi:hypothetical protein